MKEKKYAVVIMAAGKGTRMKDPSKAKVMYEILGRPMLYYVIELAKELKALRIIVIVGYQRVTVIDHLKKNHSDVEIAIQAEQLGTGHAIMQTENLLKDFHGNILILSGDVPMLSTITIQRLIDYHQKTESDATILTADYDDPTGYGRIVRNIDGTVKSIIEHKDANDEEKRIMEINSGIYIIDRIKLFQSLKNITPQNIQKEYYLTDIFTHFWNNRWKVSALKTQSIDEIRGINTIEQLEECQQILMKRQDRDLSQ